MRIKALCSLRWNYKRRGVWVWLKGKQRCAICGGRGRAGLSGVRYSGVADFPTCFRCEGTGSRRGYQRILSEPKAVIREQTALAEGVFA